jgi:hypothetical protein
MTETADVALRASISQSTGASPPVREQTPVTICIEIFGCVRSERLRGWLEITVESGPRTWGPAGRETRTE